MDAQNAEVLFFGGVSLFVLIFMIVFAIVVVVGSFFLQRWMVRGIKKTKNVLAKIGLAILMLAVTFVELSVVIGVLLSLGILE